MQCANDVGLGLPTFSQFNFNRGLTLVWHISIIVSQIGTGIHSPTKPKPVPVYCNVGLPIELVLLSTTIHGTTTVPPQYKYHTVILLNCDVCPHFLRGKSRDRFF